MTRFSVVTITRNDLAGLQKTASSLAAQQFRDFEHVVVDGGSSDGSAEWIAEYAERAEYPVSWISEPDGGIYDGMNKGIGMVSGEYVVFMNSADQFYSSLTLGFVSDRFAASGARWLVGQLQFVNDEDDLVEVTSQHRFSTRSQAMGLSYCPHQAVYMERSLLQEDLVKFDEDFSYAADQELCLRAGLIANPLVIPDYLGLFLAGGTHSLATGRQREGLYRRMRQKNGLTIRNNDLADRGFTAIMATYRDTRAELGRRYRAVRRTH